MMPPRPHAAAASVVVVAVLSGCSDYAFRSASRGLDKGEYGKAAAGFEAFGRKYASDPRAPEALVRAAWIYHRKFSRCAEARPLYEAAARGFPADPWGKAGRKALVDCPEYFPLRDGMTWEYADVQSGGKIARVEVKAQELPPPDLGPASPQGIRDVLTGSRGKTSTVVYAGFKKAKSYVVHYVKEDWTVWEIASAEKTPLLRYPYTPGTSWQGTREGSLQDFSVETDSATVTVTAGTFRGCLKLKRSMPGASSWYYDYYAPGVGLLKTTVAGPDFEAPAATELKSYKIP